MAFPNGFHYLEGGFRMVYSDVSSTATFLAHNPVTFIDATRTLVEADSQTTWILGIAQANAADSIGGTLAGKCPVLIPNQDTVFATKIQTGVTAANAQVGEAFDIEKAADHFRVDTDSASSARVVLVARGYSNSAIDSVDSSVYCQFLQDFIGPYGSTQSRRYD